MNARSSCYLRKTSSYTTGRSNVAADEVSEQCKTLCSTFVFKASADRSQAAKIFRWTRFAMNKSD